MLSALLFVVEAFVFEKQDAKQKLLREAFQIVSKRDLDSCNFVEYNENKLIYRHYATLYFVFAVDSTESEYDIFEMIHMFVQCLDQNFENVCELDLIFHSERVNHILNELFMERQESGVLTQMGSKIKSVVDTKTEKFKADVEKRYD
ncbi:unnamed protein product [Adineta ricciae]|uniref:AP complex mu/sigma subunit domain-containing protein n=1 Tax=Adineta ricciae TaxID=249248 RepID=A0A815N3K2_ADIRI|nr:unnamed protein product [Adineta ricciae]